MCGRFFLNDNPKYILSFIGYCILKKYQNKGYFEIVEHSDADEPVGLLLSMLLVGIDELDDYTPFTSDARGWYLRFDEVTHMPDSKDSQVHKIYHQIRQELV